MQGGEESGRSGRNFVGGPGRLTAVGIDRDRNSQQAVKWAVDHLLIDNQSIILVHVRSRAPAFGFAMAETTPDAVRQQIEAETTQIFMLYRGFCTHKGIALTEVVLEDSDVAKALNEYINLQQIHNFVVGSSTRITLAKKFRHIDVAATVVKTAPEFCAVYVISKGKAVTVRSAESPLPASPTAQAVAAVPNNLSDPDDSANTPRKHSLRGLRRGAIPSPLPPHQMKPTPREKPLSGDKPAPGYLQRESTDSDFQGSIDLGFKSGSDCSVTIHISPSLSIDGSDNSSSVSSKQDLEAEMKRLKRELKQTMDMYSNACKEAIKAKQKAKELVQLKMEESQKFEEARNAEEAALAMVEMEKAKCKAAIEAAQRIAETETKKRRQAELKARRESDEKIRALDALAHSDPRYRKYSINDIELATEYFSKSLKIGEGGYGPVYRACLDHTPVAIKVLRPDAAQGRKQFNQEVEVLSCIRHPNMVLLRGACPEYGCLVYEYMDNGSLEDRLARRGNTPSIPWPLRFKIAAEIATALLFLHQTKPEPLVHRDLKPANILLDHNYMSKISDVGLARLVPPSVANEVTQYHITSAARTFCYIDPEYQQTGMLGCKSDVYSLGVMLLQIVTAKSPMGLTHHVQRAIDKGTFKDMLDPTVKDWPLDECLSFAKLTLKCTELRRKDRPDLGTVIVPELNRLRNLGHAYENNTSFSSSSTRSNVSSYGGLSGEMR